ncbi:hypothetical protein [Desulfopila sp. IMCC35008]|nr:hypothetical protein [Desulfopila sp. IMCC35008]
MKKLIKEQLHEVLANDMIRAPEKTIDKRALKEEEPDELLSLDEMT